MVLLYRTLFPFPLVVFMESAINLNGVGHGQIGCEAGQIRKKAAVAVLIWVMRPASLVNQVYVMK